MNFEEKLEKYKIQKTKNTEFIFDVDVECVPVTEEFAKTLIPKDQWEIFKGNMDTGNKVDFDYQVQVDCDHGYGDYGDSCSINRQLIVTVSNVKTQAELEKEILDHEEYLERINKRKAAAERKEANRKKKEKKEDLALLEKLASKYGKKIS